MNCALSLPAAILSTGDRARLELLAQALIEQFHPLAEPLLRKLEAARICEAHEVPETAVKLERFVVYRITSKAEERRLLIDPADSIRPEAELPVVSPVGISLVGMSAGDRVWLIGADSPEPRWIDILTVGPDATGRIGWR